MTDFNVTLLGTGGTVPSKLRALPATLIRHGGDAILVDCGEGTQRQALMAGGLPDLDAILLTHYHTDHTLGLPGLLNSLALRGRERSLPIFGPPGLHGALEKLIHGREAKRMIVPIELSERGGALAEITKRQAYALDAIPVDHGRARAFGYALNEPDRPGRFDPDLARQLGVPEGPAWGLLQRGETWHGEYRAVRPDAVCGPARKGRKVVISGDTGYSVDLECAAAGADVLIHEASYLETDTDRKAGHSTASDAANLAERAGAEQLVLYHLPARHHVRAIRAEAERVLEGSRQTSVHVASDLDVLRIAYQ